MKSNIDYLMDMVHNLESRVQDLEFKEIVQEYKTKDLEKELYQKKTNE